MNDEAVCRTALATKGLLNILHCTGLGHSKSQRILKLHRWLNSSSIVAEWVDFAIGGVGNFTHLAISLI